MLYARSWAASSALGSIIAAIRSATSIRWPACSPIWESTAASAYAGAANTCPSRACSSATSAVMILVADAIDSFAAAFIP